MTELPPQLFDRELLKRRRNRSARNLTQYSFLAKRAFDDMLDRVESITRDFDRAMILGGGPDLQGEIQSRPASEKIGWLGQSDLAPRVATTLPHPALALDEERLPLADDSLDLVLAPLNLHWTNDLPGVLVQINRALKPDGFFAGALFGGSTLTELRQSLMSAETELHGGASARVSPLAGTFDMAALLQRAGFAMPVADIDRITVRYDNVFKLMHDLRGMAETNTLADRSRMPATRSLMLRAAEIYAERFADPDGRIRASFEIVHFGGWAPHPDQPKAKRPGSATARLADALGVKEQSAGEKAGG
ncbi:MAG: methyltransferase domain-containing protein [Maricaulis sp.]|jgi:SAM-dependent methyltransferase|uniref:methyltransferase domain-containing protein n=1 Tax=Maricaulis sp. TaxID=1486257 RepID=UPI001B137078|nr:methyltransferase domain-containing protein [Maricaulis sp.]MBO6729266.1 methyltransferase domain-containing protein [Maricaulis sp.]MBO6847991.1 methyltransferase domain-containing protein [Maricaulis sp.]MBO6877631.1 methyltransferase domain-containing protein [Maricaulis sp.]MDM7984123.1 methyltransferase domain-containing protein [Maricaulis sp.]